MGNAVVRVAVVQPYSECLGGRRVGGCLEKVIVSRSLNSSFQKYGNHLGTKNFRSSEQVL